MTNSFVQICLRKSQEMFLLNALKLNLYHVKKRKKKKNSASHLPPLAKVSLVVLPQNEKKFIELRFT